MSRGSRFDAQTVLIVSVLLYVAALALLSPGLPAAVAQFFGIRASEAFAALIIIPCLAVVMASIEIARRKAKDTTKP